jgi:monoamine oxidase
LLEFKTEMTMARSSLFSHLQRTLRFAAYCEKEGISTDEAYERLQVIQLNRRSFLSRTTAIVGTVTSALTLSHPVLAAPASRVIILTVNQNGRVQDIEADQVILTLPFTLLRQVDLRLPLPEVKLRAIKTLGYGTNAKIIAGFNRRVWQQRGSNGSAFSDLPFQESWETSLGQPGNGGLLTNFLGGNRGLAANQGNPQEQARTFATQFDRLYPGTAAAYSGKAARFHWPTAPFALGSYACYLPGQYTTIRAAEGETVDNLFFAGEHTSLDFQDYMNGASESGEQAASEVLAKIRKA